MSEGHGEPPADVRSFLPRPGEPVEEYARRLRALHRDLTLVLQAVERGLAAPARPDDPPRPAPREHGHAFAPAAAAFEPEPMPRHLGRGGPRVEVVAAPSGPERRDVAEERRLPRTPYEHAGRSGDRPPHASTPVPSRPSARDANGDNGGEPAWVERVHVPPARPGPPVARVVERPRAPAEREHAWVEAPPAQAWSSPGSPSPVPQEGGASRPASLTLALALTGWLLVVALVLLLTIA